MELFTLYYISLYSIIFTSWSCLHSTISLLIQSHSHHGVGYTLLYISLLNHIHILELFTLYYISLYSIIFTSWSCLHSTVSLLIQSYSHHGVVYTLLYLS